jgi:hypothetical protein
MSMGLSSDRFHRYDMGRGTDTGTLLIMHPRVKNILSIPFHQVFIMLSNLFNSIWASTLSNLGTASISSSLMKPNQLQEQRHKSAYIEVTDNQPCMWERTSQPQLNRCSTSTEVAIDNSKLLLSLDNWTLCIWNHEVVECHVMKPQICFWFFVPPFDHILNVSRVGAEVQSEFVDNSGAIAWDWR